MGFSTKKPRIPSKNEIIISLQKVKIQILEKHCSVSKEQIQQELEKAITPEKYAVLMKILATKKPTKKPKYIV